MVVTFSDFKDREEVRIMEAFEVALRKNIASNFVHEGGDLSSGFEKFNFCTKKSWSGFEKSSNAEREQCLCD